VLTAAKINVGSCPYRQIKLTITVLVVNCKGMTNIRITKEKKFPKAAEADVKEIDNTKDLK
jgi:hypothetical protein